MALTNFTALTTEQKKVWARETWKYARNLSFVNRFTGDSENAVIHRITELTRTERGDQAVVTLVPDLETDGIVGDNTLEGNEEALKAYDEVISIDQLRQAVRSKGRITEQKSIVRFREKGRDALAYWLADRMDQLAFLTMAGVAYSTKNNGAARTSNLINLAFASDVAAPSTNRYFNWDESAQTFVAGNTATLEAGDVPTYKMLVYLKAKAKELYLRPIRGMGGDEMFHVFLSPQAMATLRLDSDFLTNVRNAMPRAKDHELFQGVSAFNSVFVDGMAIHEHRHVFNTRGLTSGVDKWGSGNNVEGCRMAFCGGQALAMADLGAGYWVEKEFDYDNQPGISYGKMFGLLKPRFTTSLGLSSSSVEDFGIINVNVAVKG